MIESSYDAMAIECPVLGGNTAGLLYEVPNPTLDVNRFAIIKGEGERAPKNAVPDSLKLGLRPSPAGTGLIVAYRVPNPPLLVQFQPVYPPNVPLNECPIITDKPWRVTPIPPSPVIAPHPGGSNGAANFAPKPALKDQATDGSVLFSCEIMIAPPVGSAFEKRTPGEFATGNTAGFAYFTPYPAFDHGYAVTKGDRVLE
jgi:hypothetical protein